MNVFRDDVQPLLGAVNDRSCVSVSVDGTLVGEANSTVPVIPASTQKLLVAAVALDVLGDDFTYTTELVGGPIAAGVLTGDVFLVGGGDPLLSGEWYADSSLDRYQVFNITSLDSLADALIAQGLTRIDGRVSGDGSRYDDEFYAPGWSEGAAGLEAGPYDALLVNDARVLGDDLRAADPNEAGAREFVRILADKGVTVVGGSGVGVAPEGAGQVAAVTSMPMSAIVNEMLMNSDNNTAELVVKELGFQATGAGSREAGLGVIADTMGSWGIDMSQVVLADGSGLSQANRITCPAMLAVLEHAGYDSPVGAGLPVAAESGTLRDIFTDSAVAGRLTGKTGTLGNPPYDQDPPAVKALAGYLPVDGGGSVDYVLILNGPMIDDQREYRATWDLLASVLDTYPAQASPAVLGPQ